VFRLFRSVCGVCFPGHRLHRTLERLQEPPRIGRSMGHLYGKRIFAPEQCWALRRGTVHVHSGGHSNRGRSPAWRRSFGVHSPHRERRSHRHAVHPGQRLMHPGPTQSSTRTPWLADATSPPQSPNISRCGGEPQPRESLRLQAVRDPLTGLYNALHARVPGTRTPLRSPQTPPLAVLMIDLDHFKRYNETTATPRRQGPRRGRGRSSALVRAEDVACRYAAKNSLSFCRSALSARRRAGGTNPHRLKEYRSQHDGQPADALTASIGVAPTLNHDRVDLLLKFADEALYQAKRAGRDRSSRRARMRVPTAKAGEKVYLRHLAGSRVAEFRRNRSEPRIPLSGHLLTESSRCRSLAC